LLAAVGLTAFGLSAFSIPASAQFGSIFDPPRPPAGVPGGTQRPAPLGAPTQMPPEEMDNEDQPPQPPPRPAARQPQQQQPGQQLGQQPVQQPGAVRGQPLPPPGQQPQQAQPQQAAPPPAAGLAPGQTLPPVQQAPAGRQQTARGTPAPANVAPQPGDEVIVDLPTQKIQNPTAVFAGLDKITGRIIAFEVTLNETVQFGALQVTPRVCYTRPPTETANTDGFVEVNEVTLQGEVKRIFGGWMFAASPGLHAVEHPIYDVWLTDCKGGAQVVADTQPTTPAARAPARSQQQPGGSSARNVTPGSGAATQPNAAQAPRPPSQQPVVRQPTLQQPAPVGPPPGFR
jgi:hypothetical protein